MSAAPSWSCSSCSLRIRYEPGRAPAGLPPMLSGYRGGTWCVRCRREDVAERAELAYSGDSPQARQQAKAHAIIRDELERDPDRPDGPIAKAAKANVAAVVDVRRELDLAPAPKRAPYERKPPTPKPPKPKPPPKPRKPRAAEQSAALW